MLFDGFPLPYYLSYVFTYEVPSLHLTYVATNSLIYFVDLHRNPHKEDYTKQVFLPLFVSTAETQHHLSLSPAEKSLNERETMQKTSTVRAFHTRRS